MLGEQLCMAVEYREGAAHSRPNSHLGNSNPDTSGRHIVDAAKKALTSADCLGDERAHKIDGGAVGTGVELRQPTASMASELDRPTATSKRVRDR